MSSIIYRDIEIYKYTSYCYKTEDIRFLRKYYNGSLLYSVDSNSLKFLKDIIDTIMADKIESLNKCADSSLLSDMPTLYRNISRSCVVAHLYPVPEKVKKRDNILKLLY